MLHELAPMILKVTGSSCSSGSERRCEVAFIVARPGEGPLYTDSGRVKAARLELSVLDDVADPGDELDLHWHERRRDSF